MLHELVALLPIKGHSARVPGKNFRAMAGKPLYRWMLDTLLELPEIDRVVINTDVPEEIRKQVPPTKRLLIRERTSALCGDEVSMNRIIEDDIEAVPAQRYVMTHATNPLLSVETIRSAVTQLRETDCDSVFGVNRFQSRFYDDQLSPVNHDPDNLIPTQDLPPWYEENSCIYVFTKESFVASGSRIGLRPTVIETPKLESLDIDTPEDWILAEAMALHHLHTVNDAETISPATDTP
ncbi:MAG: acylneuraminate cytidylyltransferase family protein [Pseudomonadota bacterium]